MRTMEYAPGRLADLFGEPGHPTMLLWHGMQADARTVVRPLAGSLAGHGATVIAPDWNSHSDDGGRADLLGSLDFAREHADDPDGMVLIGWSLGGVAAAALTLAAARFNVVLAHTVCLAGAFMVPDPIRGRVVTAELSCEVSLDGVGSTPFTLLHGVADDVVPVQASRAFAAGLERVGWPVDLVELAADHGSIAGAEYDPAADRYRPAQGGRPAQVAGEVAARIVSAIAR
ncbi:MAG TPA: alpha/beta fold hydrolase [Mycobacterium sp.]